MAIVKRFFSLVTALNLYKQFHILTRLPFNSSDVSKPLIIKTDLLICLLHLQQHILFVGRGGRRESKNPSPLGICSPCLHLMSPKRVLPESHSKVKLKLSSLNVSKFDCVMGSCNLRGGFRSYWPIGLLNELQHIHPSFLF